VFFGGCTLLQLSTRRSALARQVCCSLVKRAHRELESRTPKSARALNYSEVNVQFKGAAGQEVELTASVEIALGCQTIVKWCQLEVWREPDLF
jgi:hypothetical protein